jgi:hypothetical protein
MPDQYDALAARFGGAAAAPATAQPNYDALAQQVAQPAAQPPAQPDQRGVVRRFLGGAAEMLLPSTTPSDYIMGPLYAVQHPLDSLGLIAGAVKDAHAQQFQKAKQAASEGRYSEMLGHGLATALPLIGPAAATAGETLGSGDIAGGLGQTAGLLAPTLAPRVSPPVPSGAQTAAKGVRTKIADSLAEGVTRRYVDVAAPKAGPNKVRLGNQIAKVAPKLAREEGMGAMSRGGLQTKVEQRLTAAEAALDDAGDARPAVSAETKPIVDALTAKRNELVVQPPEGSRLIPSVTSPATIVEPPPPGGARFAEVGAKPPQIEASAYKDATRNGYKGTREQFREEFKERVRQAKSLAAEEASVSSEYGPEALLSAIRKLGGLRPFTRDIQTGRQMRGDLAAIVESFGAASTRGRRGAASIFRKNGLAVDDLVQQLQQDPRYRYIDEAALLEELDTIARNPPETRITDIEHYLRGAGVEPGKQWWIDDAGFNPNNLDAPPADALTREGRPLGQPVVPEPNQPRAQQIEQAIAELQRLGPVTSYEPLRRLRQAYDQPAKARYAPSITADYLKKQGESMGAADVTAVLREKLAEMDPQTAKANADYHVYRTAADVLKAAEETERVRPNMFRKTMGRVTGAATGSAAGGGVGAVAGILTADFIDSVARSGVTTKIHTARLLARLEDALRGNRTTQVQSLLAQLERIRDAATKTSVAAGRTQTATPR